MSMQQRLDVRLGQQLVMTPQLQMAIKLLQMNALDLQSYVNQELLDNPFLTQSDGSTEEDVNPDTKTDGDKDSSEALEGDAIDDVAVLDMGWDSMYESGRGASGGFEDDGASWEDMATEDKNLKDHLTEQLRLSAQSQVERFLGHYLIDSMDDAGYVHADLDKAAEQLGVDAEKFEDALLLVQTFDPAGVGARSLAECLKLQLENYDQMDAPAAVVLQNLELLARRDIGVLARKAGISPDDMAEVCDRITHLNPKPGLQYGSEVSTNVIPDVVVFRDSDGLWQVELNPEAMPKVLLNSSYDKVAKSAKGEDKSYVNEKQGRAQWLIKSLEQRARTIFRTTKAIVAYQADFFEYGVESLQPMTLKTVAEAIEMHESTISRVTAGKYMQTPMGVFELKYFFSSGLSTTGGNTEVASESVKAIIKRLIKEEDAKKPYSDEKLVSMLKAEGVEVARRTVAKYRESLGIQSSSKRRVRM